MISKKGLLLSIVYTLLSWTGNKPTEKILSIVRGFFKLFRYMPDFKSFCVNHYYKLHILSLWYAIISSIMVPVFVSVHLGGFWILLILLVPTVAILMVECLWRDVGDTNPSDYFKILNWKLGSVYRYFALILIIYVISLVLLSMSFFIANVFANVFFVYFFLVIFVGSTFSVTGFSIFLVIFSVIESVVSSRCCSDYYKMNARVAFQMVPLESSSTKRAAIFKIALRYVNLYMKFEFKLGLAWFNFYCNFFKLIDLSRNEEEKYRIQSALNNFASMLKHPMDLTDIVYATRQIAGVPITKVEDIYQELEFDVGLWKKLSQSKGLVLIIGILGLVLALIPAVPLLSAVWQAQNLPNIFDFSTITWF
ncbi:MAG: hypothetical protein NWF05_00820 [Candidatus Bathyarchaeota archaeon]|nr:hypothetical protein [Candidatus Bathyarchaeota archaeon]